MAILQEVCVVVYPKRVPFMDRVAGANPWKGELVIYVSEDQLTQVEYLIDQSTKGNHVLFDPAEIRDVFRSAFGSDISDEEAYEVEHHIEKIISEPTLLQKKAYFEKLAGTTRRRVIRTYFNIIENSLYEKKECPH